jgi:molybdopterin-guanine dinucleotide biosynthesis protein A
MSAAITGVILAGGEGRRMGGADKGLQLSLTGPAPGAVGAGAPAPQVDVLLISANRNLERYAGFGCPVVTDTTPGFAGPLAGCMPPWREATTPLLLSAPCDSPQLPAISPNACARR